jgi:hypothetical protein
VIPSAFAAPASLSFAAACSAGSPIIAEPGEAVISR